MAVVGILILVLLSGCAAFPFVGPSCGPGDRDIGNIKPGDNVSIKGEVIERSHDMFVIDDGTGEAKIRGGIPGEISKGDCIIVKGAAMETNDTDYDANVVYTELYKEEVVLEEE